MQAPSDARSRPRVHGVDWLTVMLAAALGYLVLYGAFLAVLAVGPAAGNGLGWAHAAIRSYLVNPFVGAGDRLDFLTPPERAHIRDVKVLFDAAAAAGVACITVLVAGAVSLRRDRAHARARAGRVLWFAGPGTVAFVLLLGLGALLDFDRFWVEFHHVLFPQGNWQFAYDSMLIRTYPTSYFEAFIARWAVVVVVVCAAITLVGRRLMQATASPQSLRT